MGEIENGDGKRSPMRRGSSTTTRARASLTAAAVVAAVFALSACGSGDDTESGSTGAAKQERIRVGVVVPSLTIKAIADLAKGAEDRAKETGSADVSVFGSTDPTEQVAKAENFITTQVDALIIDPISVPAIQPVLVKAREAGIPVISTVSDLGDEVDSSLIADEVNGGEQVGAYIADALGDSGDVALVTGTATDDVNQFRLKGFEEGIADVAGIDVVARPEGKWDRTEALARSENILTGHPDLDAFFVFNDDMAFGTAAALKAHNSDALLVGYNGASDGLDAVWDGTFDATVMLRLYGMGRTALDMAVDAAHGKAVTARVESKPLLVDKQEMQAIVDGTTDVPDDVKRSVQSAIEGS